MYSTNMFDTVCVESREYREQQNIFSLYFPLQYTINALIYSAAMKAKTGRDNKWLWQVILVRTSTGAQPLFLLNGRGEVDCHREESPYLFQM